MIRLENLTKEYDLPSGPQAQIVAADGLKPHRLSGMRGEA